MFEKILIANRGEIAVRIIRTCKELGIKTLAVYSEADIDSLHVHLADEAICIGKSHASNSYLRSDRILAAAELGNVDAIHPGYGFLSENARFADECKSCNITFIGPCPHTIKQMGNKSIAKEIAKKVKVPVTPGSDGVVPNEVEGLAIAKKIGFPIIIKAVAGGGGKGMRLVYNAASFQKEFDLARTEAEKSFGNGKLYIEKYIEEPRHIEIQLLADRHGHVVHLGERDCSIQRRYQKLVEESPSPAISPTLRRKLGEAAIRIARACNYESAGTVEFLVDRHGAFYFMEMNTRIQVEHGVTEEVCGIDLVAMQIAIADGQPLPFEQKDIRLRGHAIECRINAEDPTNNFAPRPGEIKFYYGPGGHGIRIDSQVYGGYRIPQYYDSMIGKLIAFGPDRATAIRRMDQALSTFMIEGVPTTIPFQRALMRDPVFREGKAITTKFLEEFATRLPQDMVEKSL